jgi:hypothetical protein
MNNIDKMLNEKLQIALSLSNKNMEELEKIKQPLSENSLQKLTFAFMEENKFYAELLGQLVSQVHANHKSI